MSLLGPLQLKLSYNNIVQVHYSQNIANVDSFLSNKYLLHLWHLLLHDKRSVFRGSFFALGQRKKAVEIEDADQSVICVAGM